MTFALAAIQGVDAECVRLADSPSVFPAPAGNSRFRQGLRLRVCLDSMERVGWICNNMYRLARRGALTMLPRTSLT